MSNIPFAALLLSGVGKCHHHGLQATLPELAPPERLLRLRALASTIGLSEEEAAEKAEAFRI